MKYVYYIIAESVGWKQAFEYAFNRPIASLDDLRLVTDHLGKTEIKFAGGALVTFYALLRTEKETLDKSE